MKNTFRYFIIFSILISACACSADEFTPIEDKVVEFVPRQVSFTSYDVTSPGTKAALSDSELTALEKKISTPLYFIVYDGSGDRRYFEAIDVTGNNPSTSRKLYDLYENSSFFPLTVCYLANVSYDFANSLTTRQLFDTTPLPINYAEYSETGYVGIPHMDITPKGATDHTYDNCFPMCGYVIQNADGTFPGISNGVVPIPLKRLFAKVRLNLGVNMTALSSTGSPDSYFNLTNIQIVNLPEQVLLPEAKVSTGLSSTITESPWGAKNASGYDFSDPINVNFASDTSPVIYDQDNTTEGNLESFSFAFYVPEYALLPDEDKVEANKSILGTVDQKNKPNLVDESVEKPIYLNISGFLKHELTNALSDYKLYLGENNNDSFSLIRNNEYINSMNITGVNHLGYQGDVDNRVDVKPLNLVDIFKESANCYVITRPGTYILDAYPGVIKDITSETVKLTGTPVEFYDPQNLVTINSTGKVNQIEFTVVSGDSFVDGNAIIALKDDKNTTDTSDDEIWSWHIWVVSGTTLGFGDIEDHTYDNTKATMLSRNLGASGAGESGAYYQWGRKDPFFVNASDNTAANYSAGTSNEYDWSNKKFVFRTNWSPANTRWGEQKQQDDPCPPGYKVPSNKVWNSTKNAGTIWGSDIFIYEASPLVTYPYASTILVNGKKDISPNEDVDYYIEGPITTMNLSNPRRGYVQLSEIEVSVTTTKVYGALWSIFHENNLYKSVIYEYSAIDLSDFSVEQIRNRVNIISCKIAIGSGFLRPTYGAPYSISPSELTTYERAAILGEIVLGDEVREEYYDPNFTDYTTDYGLQVRCVREDSTQQ